VNNDKRFNIASLQYKASEKTLEYAKELEHQGNMDVAFRVSELQEKVHPDQRDEYRHQFLGIPIPQPTSMQPLTKHKEIDASHDESGSSSALKKNEKVKSWQKDLSKRISLRTHPDKLKNMSEDDVDHYINIYRRATEAYQESNDALLLICGHDVRLKPKPLAKKHIEIILQEVLKLKDELRKCENSDGYVWYHMTDEAKKLFLINYVKQKGFSINEEEAVEIIRRKRPDIRQPGQRPKASLGSRRKKNEK